MIRERYFTLIELLVVVAIIGVLFSMLAPALQTAKKTARSAACMSVIKQVGYGFNNYSNDYGNWGPASYFLGTETWIRVMSKNPGNNPYGLGYIQWDFSAKTGMMMCPERTSVRTYAWSVDYAVPMTLGSSARPWKVSSDNTLMKVDTIRTPSCLGWAGDSSDYGGNGVWVVRHNKAINVIFVDLHAEHWTRLPALGELYGEPIVNISANQSRYPFSGNLP